MVVPLGAVSKARRVDLAVAFESGTGATIPLRRERSALMALLFLHAWREVVEPLASGDDEGGVRSIVYRAIVAAVLRVIASPPAGAYAGMRDLLALLSSVVDALNEQSELRGKIRVLLGEVAFWEELATFADTTTLLARVPCQEGDTYVVEATYADYWDYRRVGLIRLLPWLGVMPYRVQRIVGNQGFAQSGWVEVCLPPGVEVLRFFWGSKQEKRSDTSAVDPEEPSDASIHEQYAAIGVPGGSELGAEELTGEVQMAPTAAVTSAVGLAVLVFFVSSYIFKNLPNLAADSEKDRTILDLAAAFSALPALVAGGLAYQGEAFARHMNRGPRTLIAILAALAALLAVVVGLKEIGSFAKWVSWTLSVYAFFVAGVFGYIVAGPRWRKSDRSRRRRTTARLSPRQCQRRQFWWAIGVLGAWALGSIVFARCQLVLQNSHVFVHGFPANVWHAWWSWF